MRRARAILRVLAPFAAAGPALAGCAQHVSRGELLERIEAGDPPAIVDVRSASEYRSGHVPGAVRIPFFSLLAHTDELPEAGADPVVVYCEHGPRAGIARAQMWLAGVGPVAYLEGHMKGWRAAGLPLEQPEGATE
jgi:rhodanese-related sulfurtransferase